MQPVPNVRLQVILFLIVDGLIVASRGDAVAWSSVVALGLGVLVWFLFAVPYHFRRRHERRGHSISRVRKLEDRQMAALSFIAFGIPLGFALAMTQGLRVHDIVFSSQAATVGCALLLLAAVAIVSASIVDWYLIRPFQCGVLNRPLCHQQDPPDEQTRRAYGKWWIANRGACELIAYTCGALVLTIAFAALSELIQADTVLRLALGSFIGASTAFGLVAYVAARARYCWEYMQVQSAGIGRWADVNDIGQPAIQGFVRDVSVSPGIQLCLDPEDPRFIPLSRAHTVQTLPYPGAHICPLGCRRWVERCDRYYRGEETIADLLETTGALTAQEVANRAAPESPTRLTLAAHWHASGQLLAMNAEEQNAYPAFQFGPNGRPLAAIAAVLSHLRRYPHTTDWHAALWFATANALLDGRRPADVVRDDPTLVIETAESDVQGTSGDEP
jgi:hypothetical protein